MDVLLTFWNGYGATLDADSDDLCLECGWEDDGDGIGCS